MAGPPKLFINCLSVLTPNEIVAVIVTKTEARSRSSEESQDRNAGRSLGWKL